MSATEPEPIRVVVADDQTAVRDGLVMLLGLMPNITVLAAAADGEEALELTALHDPDVVLMDLRMPRCDGVDATRRIRAEHPRTEVVVLTTHADDASILEALAAGARGFLTKDAGRAEIGRALEAAAARQTVLDPAAHAALLAAASGRRGAPPPLPDDLTAREAEVLRLVAGGLSNPQIAGQLYVSQATVKSHINHIFAKTGARDRAQAVHYAYQHDLVQTPRDF
jgi:DNA-binding NarL/FixJ family response regulator